MIKLKSQCMSKATRNFQFIAITGGIGSGKSALGNMLRQKGYTVIDSDQIARKVVEPGQPANAEIASQFGPSVMNKNGTINRSELRKIISSDIKMRKLLESITHPRIRAISEKKAETIHSTSGDTVIFYEVPLLFESERKHDFDKIICVTAEDDIRIDRVMRRSKLTKDDVLKLVATQMDQQEKTRLSDHVIENNGSLNELKNSADALSKIIKSIF